jgi:uncharacterized protein YjbI with pentapeptide repeats
MNDERWAARAGTIPARDNRKRQLSRADVIKRLAAGERDFSGCILYGCDLSRLDLSGCNFAGADLRRAKFNMADLRGCNLNRANLFQASFVYSNLDDADLSGASWAGARFVEVTCARTVLEQAAQQAESSQAVAERTVSSMKYRRP